MVQVTESLAALPHDLLSLFYTTDLQLAELPIFAFYGPSTTGNSTLNSSRIQLHIFSAAGYQTYPRLTVAPSSPFYNAVDYLPKDQQGDEVARGLAFGLAKYFNDISEVVKSNIIVQSRHRARRPGSSPTLFGEAHAASLAAAMVPIENMADIIGDLSVALQAQSISHVDIDLVLPPGSIRPDNIEDEELLDAEDDSSIRMYGEYAPLVKLFGESTFLPTSKLRRAPSKANGLNRTKSFLRAQKLSLRREMAELVDTEERYVHKMRDLVYNMADDFRTKAKHRSTGSLSPSEQDLNKLFPASLDEILEANSSFLIDIKGIMDETEEEAMQDLEQDQMDFRASRYGGTGRSRDPTGALAFAKVLLEWFPKFGDCYQDYIRSSQEFPKLISTFLKQQSSFSQRVHQTGEQKLRSAIIEPVQRLPRYSLFIDNIVNYLPATHPALQPMLKARDMVTAICSLDPPSTDKSLLVNRLRTLVDQWPSNLLPQGRLITAVDFVELDAPYHVSANPANPNTGIFLLFADTIVVLRKSRGSTLSARGLVAEVDKPSAAQMMASFSAAAGGQRRVYELSLSAWHALSETRFTEGSDGRTIYMTSLHGQKDGLVRDRQSTAADVRAYLLLNAYDGKATRWTEEVTMARVEGRFSEEERERASWCLRHTRLSDHNMSIYAAVFEEGVDHLIEGRKEPAAIRVVVDHHKGTKGAPVGHYGVEIVINVKSGSRDSGSHKLEIAGLADSLSSDSVDLSIFMTVFAKRVSNLIRRQFSLDNPALTAAFISHYTDILKSLQPRLPGQVPLGQGERRERPKSFRAASPVKMLSSFLNAGGSMSNSSGGVKHQRTPLMGNVPMMQPPPLSRSNSKASEKSHDSPGPPSRGGFEDVRPANQLIRLEETFTGYMAALQSRKGNIVGRILRSRRQADELQVNALYNAFIENPFDVRLSSEASTDVLFCAFEKYLMVAWSEQMGPVITLQMLQSLQEKNAKLYAGDFADFIKLIFADMAPQNKRAFVAIIKLLADLLEGCGNDGDRGALTAAFADLLVHEDDPHDYINLLDRLVEDSDRLFEDIGPSNSVGFATPNCGSFNSTSRSKTGSLTSNASSLRKRFGLDSLLRSNSKNDESKSSMWRTMSKSVRPTTAVDSAASSLSKASTLGRSQSIDAGSGRNSPVRRPASRDRPTILGAFDDRPTSSHLDNPSRLSIIHDSPPPEASEKDPKKKRRSSLSDVMALMQTAKLDSSPAFSPFTTRRALPVPQHKFNSSPRTPSPDKTSIMNRTIKYGQDSPIQKENVPQPALAHRKIGSLNERPQNVMPSTDEALVKPLRSPDSGTKAHKPSVSMSNIPVLKGPRERTPSNVPSPPRNLRTIRPNAVNGEKSPQKLRLQNPQKLRERLEKEAKAISDAESSLKSELCKIGEEMSKMTALSSLRATNTDVTALTSSVKSLQSRIPMLIKDLQTKNGSISQDLEISLKASDDKVRGLDQLYKEANAENELLYEKFNGELGKIVKALKGKGKEDKEDLILKVKESSEETAKVKKENARLRRELLTLRTVLKSYE